MRDVRQEEERRKKKKKKCGPDGSNWMLRQKRVKKMKRVGPSFDVLWDQRLSCEVDERKLQMDWKSLSDKRWKEIV